MPKRLRELKLSTPTKKREHKRVRGSTPPPQKATVATPTFNLYWQRFVTTAYASPVTFIPSRGFRVSTGIAHAKWRWATGLLPWLSTHFYPICSTPERGTLTLPITATARHKKSESRKTSIEVGKRVDDELAFAIRHNTPPGAKTHYYTRSVWHILTTTYGLVPITAQVPIHDAGGWGVATAIDAVFGDPVSGELVVIEIKAGYAHGLHAHKAGSRCHAPAHEFEDTKYTLFQMQLAYAWAVVSRMMGRLAHDPPPPRGLLIIVNEGSPGMYPLQPKIASWMVKALDIRAGTWYQHAKHVANANKRLEIYGVATFKAADVSRKPQSVLLCKRRTRQRKGGSTLALLWDKTIDKGKAAV
jgi:hypothetical protein